MGQIACQSFELPVTELALTHHALERMKTRRVSEKAIQLILTYGRLVHVRGADIYAVGRREVEQSRLLGIDLGALEGLQVVCSSDGAVITVYRNKDFRGLRPSGRGRTWANA